MKLDERHEHFTCVHMVFADDFAQSGFWDADTDVSK